MVMELRQLRYFIAVVEERSFTRAAQQLYIAQPGISAQIKNLEREVGQKLLDRAGREVRLTAAGTAFLPHAREALTAVQRGQDSVDAVAGLTQGTITLGTVPNLSFDQFDLPILITQFHQLYPGIDINLIEDNADELAGAVREARLDAALISLGHRQPEGVDLHIVASSPLVAAAHPDYWFLQHDSITLPELIKHTLLLMPQNAGARMILNTEFQRLGLAPRVAVEVGDPLLLAQLASAGLGIAVIPQAYAGDLPHSHLSPTLTGQIAIASRNTASTSPAVDALLNHLRRAGRNRSTTLS